jgi:hypothetical protein
MNGSYEFVSANSGLCIRSTRLHTFTTVIGLKLVSLACLAAGTQRSARDMMSTLSTIEATWFESGRNTAGSDS